MDSENRMDGCVCANGAKVAEIVYLYCPVYVPPEVEAEIASLRAEVARLAASTKDARIVAIVREWGGRRAMNQKLLLPKACPWCKGIPYVEHDTGMWRVVCLVEACPVSPCTVQTEDRDEIVARWNRRNNNAKEGD